KLIALSGIGGVCSTSFLFLITAAGGTAAFSGLAWGAWPGGLYRIVFRKTVEGRAAGKFVWGGLLPTPVWPFYSPYIYDGTTNQLINDCPHVNPHPYHYYCWYTFNLYSTPNAIENHNLLDIQFPSIRSQLAGSISRSVLEPAHLGPL